MQIIILICKHDDTKFFEGILTVSQKNQAKYENRTKSNSRAGN